jgi:ankyrin repeat protein
MFTLVMDHGADIDQLLQQGADSNIRDNNGETALMMALQHGKSDDEYVKVVDLFNQYMADIDIADNSGETCLMVAAHNDCPKTVHRLIDLGADVNSLNNAGVSPLALARQQNRLKIAELLESLGGKDIRPVAKAE